jgi:alpha-L-fucosidase 2
MLMQSKNGEIHLLPALPSAWPKGEVKGLCARGAFTIDLAWSAGRLVTARVQSHAGQVCKLRLGEQSTSFPTKAGSTYRIGADLKLI